MASHVLTYFEVCSCYRSWAMNVTMIFGRIVVKKSFQTGYDSFIVNDEARPGVGRP